MKKLLTFLLLGVFFLSCGKNEGEKTPKENGKTENTATESKETLVASTAPLKWLVEKIAGDNYNVIYNRCFNILNFRLFLIMIRN